MRWVSAGVLGAASSRAGQTLTSFRLRSHDLLQRRSSCFCLERYITQTFEPIVVRLSTPLVVSLSSLLVDAVLPRWGCGRRRDLLSDASCRPAQSTAPPVPPISRPRDCGRLTSNEASRQLAHHWPATQVAG
jgi:hypothetical protein